MTTQPEALRLAEVLELNHKFCPEEIYQQAAVELRRLHATLAAREDEIQTHSAAAYEATRLLAQAREENEALLEALEKIAAIEDKMVGSDWEEIEEARMIARAAIAKAEQK